MYNFKKCPRCQENAYEKLSTHGYCFNCNYSPDLAGYKKSSSDDLPIPPWASDAAAMPRQSKQEGSAA
jgi:hypothetical protein